MWYIWKKSKRSDNWENTYNKIPHRYNLHTYKYRRSVYIILKTNKKSAVVYISFLPSWKFNYSRKKKKLFLYNKKEIFFYISKYFFMWKLLYKRNIIYTYIYIIIFGVYDEARLNILTSNRRKKREIYSKTSLKEEFLFFSVLIRL